MDLFPMRPRGLALLIGCWATRYDMIWWGRTRRPRRRRRLPVSVWLLSSDAIVVNFEDKTILVLIAPKASNLSPSPVFFESPPDLYRLTWRTSDSSMRRRRQAPLISDSTDLAGEVLLCTMKYLDLRKTTFKI